MPPAGPPPCCAGFAAHMDPVSFGVKTRDADRLRADDGTTVSCVLRPEDSVMITVLIGELQALVERLGGQQRVYVSREATPHYGIRIGLPFTITPAALRQVRLLNDGKAMQLYRSPITEVHLCWPRWNDHQAARGDPDADRGLTKTPHLYLRVRMSYSYTPPIAVSDLPPSPCMDNKGDNNDNNDDDNDDDSRGMDLFVAPLVAGGTDRPPGRLAPLVPLEREPLEDQVTRVASTIISEYSLPNAAIVATSLRTDYDASTRLLITGLVGDFPERTVAHLERAIQACAARSRATARLLFVWPSAFWNPDATEPTLCVDLFPMGAGSVPKATTVEPVSVPRGRPAVNTIIADPDSVKRARSRSRERV